MMWRRTLSTWSGATFSRYAMPVVGQHGEHHPPVEVGRPALDDAHPHEPVEAAGEAARGELQEQGQVAHPHRVVVGLGQVHEHLVVAERQAVRREVRLEGRVEVDDGLGVGAPGGHLLVVQPAGLTRRTHSFDHIRCDSQ